MQECGGTIYFNKAGSEFSISFCVREADAAAACAGVEASFALERELGRVDPLDVRTDVGILSVVGDGMRARTGTAGTLFHALAAVDVNVVAIAQGSSERNFDNENVDLVKGICLFPMLCLMKS